ncbi:hypothetical protein GJ744_010233 [Endocarpon pusillum]|uniref:Uncharacterized protein n=1 Tax=Endocarpon pusillum TaxID=364733 RepID=A0A8H7AM98_9EURO|nr:hypothetical protein GJ744_010233 [Endocarpon pusillum]
MTAVSNSESKEGRDGGRQAAWFPSPLIEAWHVILCPEVVIHLTSSQKSVTSSWAGGKGSGYIYVTLYVYDWQQHQTRALPRYGVKKIDDFIWIARPVLVPSSVRTAHQLLLTLILFHRLYMNIRLLFESESQTQTTNERRKLQKLASKA